MVTPASVLALTKATDREFVTCVALCISIAALVSPLPRCRPTLPARRARRFEPAAPVWRQCVVAVAMRCLASTLLSRVPLRQCTGGVLCWWMPAACRTWRKRIAHWCVRACVRAGFLCPIEANTYGIMFRAFCIKDYDTKRVLFQVGEFPDGSGAGAGGEAYGADSDEIKSPTLEALEALSVADTDTDPDSMRTIRYDFNVDVLRLPTISTMCVLAAFLPRCERDVRAT
jgi:hypothetical protein